MTPLALDRLERRATSPVLSATLALSLALTGIGCGNKAGPPPTAEQLEFEQVWRQSLENYEPKQPPQPEDSMKEFMDTASGLAGHGLLMQIEKNSMELKMFGTELLLATVDSTLSEETDRLLNELKDEILEVSTDVETSYQYEGGVTSDHPTVPESDLINQHRKSIGLLSKGRARVVVLEPELHDRIPDAAALGKIQDLFTATQDRLGNLESILKARIQNLEGSEER